MSGKGLYRKVCRYLQGCEVSVRGRLLIVLLGMWMTAPVGWGQADASPAERALLQMANEARGEHGLPPLGWDSALAKAARVHAQRVLREPGELEHQYPGEPDIVARTSAAGAHFASVAENLARRGTTPAALQQIWMSTAVHRANILSPEMTVVGIGVIESQGLLYAVEDFARGVAVPQQGGVERQVMESMRRSGMTAVKATEAARASCEAGRDTSGGAALVVAWDGSDPGKLPDALVQQMRSGRYQTAAVGACPSRQVQPGFTTYRVTVLLYGVASGSGGG